MSESTLQVTSELLNIYELPENIGLNITLSLRTRRGWDDLSQLNEPVPTDSADIEQLIERKQAESASLTLWLRSELQQKHADKLKQLLQDIGEHVYGFQGGCDDGVAKMRDNTEVPVVRMYHKPYTNALADIAMAKLLAYKKSES